MIDWSDGYHCPVSDRRILCTEAKNGNEVFKAAIRKARLDALEEAAKAVQNRGDQNHKIGTTPRYKIAAEWALGAYYDAAATIRSLKDKQP